jgi:tetratricopeptide (TPR) repeat protein
MNNIEMTVATKAESVYLVHLPNTDAEHEFNFRFDLSEKEKLQHIKDGISHGDAGAEFEAHLKAYGDKLYNLLMGGAVGEEFKRLSKDGFCLRLHLPPNLEALPWEYLATKDEFLFKSRENFLIRKPSPEEIAATLQEMTFPLRQLVIISNPPDLPEHKKLDVVREKRLIKGALKPLMDEGRLVVRWEDEASLERIHDALLDFDPHIIHYTGHGGFDGELGGVLLLEDGSDRSQNVSGTDLAERIAGRDVRLVVLSGCQTAEAKTMDSFSSVAGALARKGVPAVIAMQQSIRDDSATTFASRFYKALASGEPVDLSLSEARLSMSTPRSTKENPEPHSFVDWGIPVLITSASDLNLFNLDTTAPPPLPPPPEGFSKVNLPNPGDIFVGRQIEQRRIARALRGGDARCIMVLGPGGIGKSSLAARAVEQSKEHFHAAFAIDCRSTPTAEQILLEVGTFLKLNGNDKFSQVMEAPLETEQKIEYLPQILNAVRSHYLLIFDNFEDMLDPRGEPHTVKDELIRHLLETLTINLRESRVIVTSRLDFVFTRDNRYQGNILSVNLPDLTRMEAFRLIENMPSLDRATDEEKLLIHEKAGGSPYIIDLVAARAKDVSVGSALLDIAELQKEFVETTLLNKLYEWLPDDATRKLFRRASVYRRPVTQDFLVAMGGDDDRIRHLLHKSLLGRVSADLYEMHTNTRSFASDLHKQIDGASGLRGTQVTAAQMYLSAGEEKGDIGHTLESHWFFYTAGEYDTAGEMVQGLFEPLYRWGFIDLVRGLNEETAETATGTVKAAALHHLGIIHQDQGRYDEAVEMYQKSLKIEEELGNRSGIASTLHQLGNVQYDRGRYDEAVTMYKESLKISEELGDRRKIAYTIGQMGRIHQEQGRYDEAIELFQQVKQLSEELRDKSSIAIALHNMGMIHQDQGRYDEAVTMYQESLKIKEELGNRSGIASTLHQLGIIHHDQGRYDEAVTMYQESLKIEEELGNRSGIASTLHQLGIIHQDRGRYDEAVTMYQESLKIKEELGNRSGIAISIGQMGWIFQAQGNYKEALRSYLNAFAIFYELNSPNKDIVGQNIMSLKEEIGDALFDKYCEEMTADE